MCIPIDKMDGAIVGRAATWEDGIFRLVHGMAWAVARVVLRSPIRLITRWYGVVATMVVWMCLI